MFFCLSPPPPPPPHPICFFPCDFPPCTWITECTQCVCVTVCVCLTVCLCAYVCGCVWACICMCTYILMHGASALFASVWCARRMTICSRMWHSNISVIMVFIITGIIITTTAYCLLLQGLLLLRLLIVYYYYICLLLLCLFIVYYYCDKMMLVDWISVGFSLGSDKIMLVNWISVALLSVQKLWSVYTVFWLCPSQLWNIKMALIAAHLNTGSHSGGDSVAINT